MNARETAIDQAQRYWAERGIAVESDTLAARQAEVVGSVWWVEGRALARRYDVLVRRLDKRSFQFTSHCPWGYTIYVCHGSGETPLEVVEYEEVARERVKVLGKSRLYTRASSLTYLANPSAAWRDGMIAHLAARTARKAANHEKKVTELRLARYEQHVARKDSPRTFPLLTPSHNERAVGITLALQNGVFDLFARAFAAASIVCSPMMERNLRKLIATRIQQEACLPLGCMWTPVRCLLFLPGDAGSHNELQGWITWKEQAYCLWFDGSCLRECSYDELEGLLEKRQP